MKFDVFKTEYGIVIPTCAKLEKVQQTRYFMDEFENDESCTQSRLKSLNVNLNVNVKMGCRAGYNMKNDSISSSSTSEYSFLFEQRMFELKIGNYEEQLRGNLETGMTFTKNFKSQVKKLPRRYKKGDRKCKNKFERFFDRFGHFLVSSAYAGGSVEIKCYRKIVDRETTSVEEVKASLAASLEHLDVATTEFSAARGTSSDHKARTWLNRCTYLWDGGATALHAKGTIVDKEQFQKWKASLLLNPTMLTSEMNLDPISTAVGCVDDSKNQATYDALKDLLGVEMKIPVKKEKDTAEENTKKEATTRKESLYKPTNVDRETCFPSSSVVNVQRKDGVIKQKKMADLEVGDKVMSWDEKRNRAIFTQAIMFAHHASDAMDVEYLKIALEDGNKITLSGNHLVMVGEYKKAIMAQKVKPGDILFTVEENLEISPKKVLAVEKVIEQGVYCPITLHGNLIVDNVLASCYASVQDHVFLEGLVKISAQSIAHFGLMPMRALHKLRSKWLRKISNGQTIHPYVQWLCKLNLPWMAN